MQPHTTQAADPSQQFLQFMQQQAQRLREADAPPGSLDEWTSHKKMLRQRLQKSWGEFPKERCPLEPRGLGELKRDGYRVEKLVLQTRPGVWMSANAYVPQASGRVPAVLCVHGHWRGAKQDAVVQSRAVGLAKLGFFVLAVDAFGAGERGLQKTLGEYHGEMVASTLWPTGLALAGLQVYENMRAVDYLQSRPEVDPDHIGITGASGGGNQTMYAGAFDERIGCVAPVCSVGTYQAYLGIAACMCEVVPAALSFTEEWGLLAMAAPRALMVVSASEDAFQFSPAEAAKSVAAARRVFELYGVSDRLKHVIVESKHDYNRPMREAMYGWMTLHLKGEGDGRPIPEPKIETEDPEALRCFPGDSRPGDFITIPRFAAAEGRRILARRKPPEHIEHWDAASRWMLESLAGGTLGKFPKRTPVRVTAEDSRSDTQAVRNLNVQPEPGITVTAQLTRPESRKNNLFIVLHADGMHAAERTPFARELRRRELRYVTADLRSTGRFAYPRDAIGHAVDHNTAQWALWCGLPLLGQWVWDVSRLLDALDVEGELPENVTAVGFGSFGIVAICAAALDRRIEQAAAIEMPASYVSDEPYRAFRVGVLAPGILRDVGDIPQLAALVAPHRLVIGGGTTAAGETLAAEALKREFEYTTRVFELEDSGPQLTILAAPNAGEIVSALAVAATQK